MSLGVCFQTIERTAGFLYIHHRRFMALEFVIVPIRVLLRLFERAASRPGPASHVAPMGTICIVTIPVAGLRDVMAAHDGAFKPPTGGGVLSF